MQKARYARTKQELARALGITGWTLNSYWDKPARPKDHGDGSSRYDIAEYRRWIASFKSAHNFGNGHNNGGYPVNEREQALIRKKEIEIERETFKLDVERGKYWPKEDSKSLINRYAGALWRELEKALVHELPARDEGLSAGEIAKVHKERLRSIRSNVDKILIA